LNEKVDFIYFRMENGIINSQEEYFSSQKKIKKTYLDP